MTVLISMINTSATTLLVVMGLAIVLGLMHIVNLAQTGFMAVGVYTGLEVGPPSLEDAYLELTREEIHG